MSGWNIIAALSILGLVFSGYSIYTAAYGTTMAFVLLVSFFLLAVSLKRRNAAPVARPRSQQLAIAKRSVGSLKTSRGIHLIGPSHRDSIAIADIANLTMARKKAVKAARKPARKGAKKKRKARKASRPKKAAKRR